MYGLTLTSNLRPLVAADTALAFVITIGVLYLIALVGLKFKQLFYFAFFMSRIVVVVCLSIIINSMIQTIPIIRNALNQAATYEIAVGNTCGDPLALVDSTQIKAQMNEAKSSYIGILVFSWIVLGLTIAEILCGWCCVQPYNFKKIVENVKEFAVKEWWQFLIIGYYKFN